MNGLLVTSAVAPLLAAPSLRSETISQLVLGEAAEVLETQGAMSRVRTLLDRYEGWVHQGYTHATSAEDVAAWHEDAAWSEGALLEDDDGMLVRAPHRARLRLAGSIAILPDGRRATVISGQVRPLAAVAADAGAIPPADWAWREFAGTPYLWGGVTAAGIDCSGLVQTTFLLRGIPLPRDARQQVEHGLKVELSERRAGDLLFFRNTENDSIGHVAILAGHETIVHSAVDTGGVVKESWAEGSRVAALRERLVAVRRTA